MMMKSFMLNKLILRIFIPMAVLIVMAMLAGVCSLSASAAGPDDPASCATHDISVDGDSIVKYLGDPPFYLTDSRHDLISFDDSGVRKLLSVDESGLVTIKGCGRGTLYVYYNTDYGTQSKSVNIRIEDPANKPEPEIEFTVPKNLTPFSKSFNLNARTTIGDAKLTYQSRHPDKMIVDQNGTVTIVEHTKCFTSFINIFAEETATTAPAFCSAYVTTNPVPQKVICPSSVKSTFGRSCTLKSTVKAGKLNYKSRNTKTAKVDAHTGKVKFLHPGIVTVTVTASGNAIYGKAQKNIKIKCTMKKPVLKVNTPGKRCAKITWSKVPGAQKYELYVRYPGKSKYKAVLTRSSKVKSITHHGLKKGKKYSYKVRAYMVSKGKKYYGPFSEARTIKVK